MGKRGRRKGQVFPGGYKQKGLIPKENPKEEVTEEKKEAPITA